MARRNRSQRRAADPQRDPDRYVPVPLGAPSRQPAPATHTPEEVAQYLAGLLRRRQPEKTP